MIVSLIIQLIGLAILLQVLRSGPLKLIMCVSVGTCAAFETAVIINLHSAIGLLLFAAWLIASVAQLGGVVVLAVNSQTSVNRLIVILCVIITNAANIWFGAKFFNAVG